MQQQFIVNQSRNMNFFCSWIILWAVSFIQITKASTNYEMYHRDYASDYCVLGNTPVCATNGHEYFRLDNECELNSFNSKQLEKGQLVLSKTSLEFCYPPVSPLTYSEANYNTYCPQYCTNTFKPLCASYRNVQRNFTNECLLKKHICDSKENWQIILNGTCVAASCPLNGQEICASYNGYTQSFPNLLSLYGDIQARGKNWQILNVGPCPCPCPEDYRPICARLNCTAKTFTNECFLQREIKNGNFWSLLFYGECPELPTTPSPVSPASADIDLDDGEESGDGPLDIDAAVENALNEEPKTVVNKPVYIVKKSQLSPYMTPQYQNKPSGKPIDYYARHNLPKSYQNSYEKSTKKLYDNEYHALLKAAYSDPKSYKNPVKKQHEKLNTPHIKTLYNEPNSYKKPAKNPYEKLSSAPKTLNVEPNEEIYGKNLFNYAANAGPPDYQSFFKPLNAPLALSAISLVSAAYTNNNDYYAPKSITDVNYQAHYGGSPVSIAAYSHMGDNNYADVNYSDEDLYDSLYGSFT